MVRDAGGSVHAVGSMTWWCMGGGACRLKELLRLMLLVLTEHATLNSPRTLVNSACSAIMAS
jgi:hypothetical protein